MHSMKNSYRFLINTVNIQPAATPTLVGDNTYQELLVRSLLIFCCLVSGNSFCQSFSFLNTPTSARLAALGGVNVSLHDRDVNFFSSNPSLAGDTLTEFASANYHFYVADVGVAAFTFQPSFKSTGPLTLGVQHMGYGTIDSYDASGAHTGSFTSGETALSLAKHFQSNAFRFGATFKTVFSNLAGYNATALAFDVGGLYIHPKQALTIGLAFKNIGLVLTDYEEGSQSQLPFDVQVGTTFKPEHMPFRFSLTAFDLTRYDAFENRDDKLTSTDKVMRHLNASAELLLSKNVNVLVGYNFRKRQELKLAEISGGAGFSFGASIRLKKAELVINRTSFGVGQASYGFTLSANLRKMIMKRETI
jgi:hypothetical protein